jgi:hypothetical protein
MSLERMISASEDQLAIPADSSMYLGSEQIDWDTIMNMLDFAGTNTPKFEWVIIVICGLRLFRRATRSFTVKASCFRLR